MSFRHVIALAALFGAGSLMAQEPAAPPVATAPAAAAAAAPLKPGDANSGQAKSATCGACHGIDGNPASSQYPKLAGQHENYIARQIELIKTNQRANPVMMGFIASMTPQDMHDVGAYFASKSSLPGVADAKLVAKGEALYRGGDKATNTPALREVRADGRVYHLRGTLATGWMPGGEAGVLVTAAFELVNPLTDLELRSRYGLSAREVEVARLVATGLSNQEVAEQLGVSYFTARNHVERVLSKLGVGNRSRVGAVLRNEAA